MYGMSLKNQYLWLTFESREVKRWRLKGSNFTTSLVNLHPSKCCTIVSGYESTFCPFGKHTHTHICLSHLAAAAAAAAGYLDVDGCGQ